MTCNGRRKTGTHCGGVVYRCASCGATGCSMPGCSAQIVASGSCTRCKKSTVKPVR